MREGRILLARRVNRQEIVRKFPRREDQLLPLLHALQRANPQNYLTPDDLRAAAEHLRLPLAAVYDAVTFYSMFSLFPRGRHIIRVCRSPTCHLLGAIPLIEALERELGIRIGETTPDGFFTLEAVSCLGLCDRAPALMIDGESFGPLAPKDVRELLTQYREVKR